MTRIQDGLAGCSNRMVPACCCLWNNQLLLMALPVGLSACWCVSSCTVQHANMRPVALDCAYRPPHSRASIRMASCLGKWSMAATALAAVRSLGPAPERQPDHSNRSHDSNQGKMMELSVICIRVQSVTVSPGQVQPSVLLSRVLHAWTGTAFCAAVQGAPCQNMLCWHSLMSCTNPRLSLGA
jgi:hypothetical protein